MARACSNFIKWLTCCSFCSVYFFNGVISLFSLLVSRWTVRSIGLRMFSWVKVWLLTFCCVGSFGSCSSQSNYIHSSLNLQTMFLLSSELILLYLYFCSQCLLRKMDYDTFSSACWGCFGLYCHNSPNDLLLFSSADQFDDLWLIHQWFSSFAGHSRLLFWLCPMLVQSLW